MVARKAGWQCEEVFRLFVMGVIFFLGLLFSLGIAFQIFRFCFFFARVHLSFLFLGGGWLGICVEIRGTLALVDFVSFAAFCGLLLCGIRASLGVLIGFAGLD